MVNSGCTFLKETIQTDPHFIAESTDAEVYLHDKLKNAFDDAEEEFKKSVQRGWLPYEGGTI